MTSLVFSTTPEGLHELARRLRLGGNLSRSKPVQRTKITFLDTPDLGLYRNGIELRMTWTGDRLVQRVTRTLASGAQIRETDIEGSGPDIDSLPAKMRKAVLACLDDEEPAPVLIANLEHRTRMLRETAAPDTGAIFDLTFTQGVFESAGEPVPTAALVLNLREGPAGATQRLALELRQLVPLHIEVRSLLAQGLQQACGVAPVGRKAPRPACARDATIDSAIADLFGSGLEHLLANESAALDGRSAEGVHQMRVALRRMRSAWSAFGPLLNDPQVEALKGEAKWLANALCPARDWDVFLAEQLDSIAAIHPEDSALVELRSHAEAARRDAYRTAQEALQSERAARFVLELGEWIEGRGWRLTPVASAPGIDQSDDVYQQPLAGFATATLEGQYRKIRKRGRKFAALPAEKRHRLRIAIKKLRYTAEFFVLLYDPASARDFVKECAGLQDALGVMNDAATLGDRLDALQVTAPDDTLLARGIGMALGTTRARAAARGEAGVRAAWQRFRQQPVFWPKSRA